MAVDEWVQLEEGNDWGAIYYALPGECLRNGTASRKNGVPLLDGQVLSVLFPDGTHARLPLRKRSSSAQIYDHGRSYGVTQERFGFEVENHGLRTWTPLTDVRVHRAEFK